MSGGTFCIFACSRGPLQPVCTITRRDKWRAISYPLRDWFASRHGVDNENCNAHVADGRCCVSGNCRLSPLVCRMEVQTGSDGAPHTVTAVNVFSTWISQQVAHCTALSKEPFHGQVENLNGYQRQTFRCHDGRTDNNTDSPKKQYQMPKLNFRIFAHPQV